MLLVHLKASGFVLYRRSKRHWKYLTLRNAGHGDLGAPKGHAKKGESELETALRETTEETAIRAPDLVPQPQFRRTSRYLVTRRESGEQREKEVVYFAARSETKRVRISKEHSSYRWLDLDEVLAGIRHEDLRTVFRDAAIWLKDPILRKGLDPAAAKALLMRECGEETRLPAHSAEVARVARVLAEAWGGIDNDYVESAALLHDIGRTRTHGEGHPLDGFRLLVDLGHPGHAPGCITHYTKGAQPEELGLEPAKAAAFWEACDQSWFPVEERLIALADSLVAGSRCVSIEQRLADLRARYGDAGFFDTTERRCLGLKAAFEDHTGTGLYPLVLR